ncbi:HNH endonuclease signature motif containing protein [Pengzhenrongella sicca]|uniref:DUF222 domain-containing protein n=1 Tax=Pengzhenrongella sicca TaxID=2819238 RepID=A0A8A4ZKI2_9MICO|nr:HNH endonuclease signature motif containing protein [Pengzhenrongella sicca]QTE30098.1 DUF222 domain-containing protein [Pengzhenrongella sicca]
MFEPSDDEVTGAPAGAGPAVAGATSAADTATVTALPVSVDVAFGVLLGRVFAEAGAALAQAAAAGSCIAGPIDQVALSAALMDQAPGSPLVELLEGLCPSDVHDAVLIEAIAAWERVTSLAAARQGEMIAELARRRDAQRLGEFVGDEVASVLVMSRSVAEAKVSLGTSLQVWPAVREALVAGVIDHRKATALVDGVGHLDDDAAAAVLDAVLPVAAGLTVPALKARLRKVELTVNPAAVAERRARDAADRYVRVSPAPGVMAWLTAYLPAKDAMTVFTAIDAIAASADPADPRGVAARRADALTDLCTDILTTGIAPTTALPGTAGPGPGTAGQAGGTPRAGGVLKTEHGRRPHLQVTAAATTLLGLDEVPGELAGYGPIPADLVRAIAADATWRRIFTDPATGCVTGIGPRGYRPGADLTGTVLARDKTCTFVGCRMPAWRCDLDHRDPYDHDHPDLGGQTCEENLHSLCRHHHRAKTYGGWHPDLDTSTGDTWWTSPTKHRYKRPSVDVNPEPPPPDRPWLHTPQPDDPPF